MDKTQKLLTDLKTINYAMGCHSGMWEYSNNREVIAEDTYDLMKEKAEEYEIPVKECLKDYFFESDWQEHLNFGIEYAYDEIAYELYEKLNEKIVEMLL